MTDMTVDIFYIRRTYLYVCVLPDNNTCIYVYIIVFLYNIPYILYNYTITAICMYVMLSTHSYPYEYMYIRTNVSLHI